MDFSPTVSNFHALGGIRLICPDSVPTVLGFLDPSIAPSLLYYSSIPIIVVALFFGLFVLRVNQTSRPGRLFLWIAIVYSLILLEELFNWIATSAALIHFGWQIDSLFLGILPYLLVYFTYTFVHEENMPVKWQWVFLLPLLPIFILTPTALNLSAFDLVNCESIQGPLRSYIYLVQFAALLFSLFLCVQRARQTRNKQERQKVMILGVGIVVFFGIYILSNVFADITLVYDINLFGPIGMAAFLTTIAYLIVRYHAFNMRVFGAQALIVALTATIFAGMFVHTVETVRYILGGTLFFVIVTGILLIRSVKREIEQRERIELLAGELQKTNEQQETLIHFIGHEVKGFLTKDAGTFASLLEGDLGPLPETMKPFVEVALAQSRLGVDSVSNILKAANLKKGTVAYAKEPFDLKALVLEAIERMRPLTEKKGLTLTLSADEGVYQMIGDKTQISDHILRNLIDNAINYTPSGSITVSLKNESGKLIFSVKDTGVGITEEDKKRLFTEGGHGKDSQTINVHSTGYGLFIAKQIAEAQGGTIRAESEGAGKGSTFVVEFPV